MSLLLIVGVAGLVGGLGLMVLVWANWDDLGPEPHQDGPR